MSVGVVAGSDDDRDVRSGLSSFFRSKDLLFVSPLNLEALEEALRGLGPNSIEEVDLSFGLKNHLSFDLRFPTLRKFSNMNSLDMSQNQN